MYNIVGAKWACNLNTVRNGTILKMATNGIKIPHSL
jgi:hypothetical protein